MVFMHSYREFLVGDLIPLHLFTALHNFEFDIINLTIRRKVQGNKTPSKDSGRATPTYANKSCNHFAQKNSYRKNQKIGVY